MWGVFCFIFIFNHIYQNSFIWNLHMFSYQSYLSFINLKKKVFNIYVEKNIG